MLLNPVGITKHNAAGQLVSTRVYHTIPASGAGSSGANYDETTFAYDASGRQNRVKTPGGTITRTVFDCLGNPTATYVGTDDTGATDSEPTGGGAQGNNMVVVTERQYDAGCGGCGSGGSLLTQLTEHVDAATTRVTNYDYDWRQRLVEIDGEEDFFEKRYYDNLGRVVKVERYDASAQGNLIARSETFYDDLGRVYRTKRYAVDPSTGDVGNALTSNSWYDAAGNRVAAEDALERRTEWQYDGFSRLTKEILPDPDDEGAALAPWTVFSYDAAGNLLSTTDTLDHATSFGYDQIGRRVSVTDPLDATTSFTFDGAGNMAALADPLGNQTTWLYDHAGRVVEEENELEDSRTFAYTADGQLAAKTDRKGRVIEYNYDLFGRRTAETWKDGQSTVREFSFTYNRQGELLTASDPAAEYTFDYDALGRVTSVTQELDGLTPTVIMEQEYDVLGRRGELATTLGASADFKNTYAFDDLGRLARIDQAEVSGGNAVAEKRIDFAHDNADRFAAITRYNSASGTQLVAGSAFTFDNTGRLVALTHTKGQTTLVDYDWTFDAANRMTQHVHSTDGTADYTSDDASQLAAADYDYDPPLADEAYTYDDNGNRTTGGHTVGACNRMTSDGTYAYLYDEEGNRTARFIDADEDGKITSGDSDITIYAWDHRNRLVEVSHFADYSDYTSESPDKVVKYAYDYQNRWVRKVFDDGEAESSTIFVYDGNQIALHFEKSGTGDAAASDLSHRYLWGPWVDQVLADEQVSDLETAGDVLWPLADHLNTLRDLATYDTQTDTITISNHRVFDAFGRLHSQTNSAVTSLFAFTTRPLDPDTLLQNNLNRWYDPAVGRWLGEDPIRYDTGEFNLYRYCGNNPLLRTDPTGEDWLDCMSACIQDNDPLPYALGAAVKGLLALGGWQSKSALATIAKALGNQKLADSIMKTQKLFANQQPVTDLLSLISMGAKGANKAAWKALQQVGGKVAAVLGPIQIGYGLALAAIESHCMGYCCTAWWYGIPYNPVDGNVIKAWKDNYF